MVTDTTPTEPAPTDPSAGAVASTGGAQAPADLADDPPSGQSTAGNPKASGAAGDSTTPPPVTVTPGESPVPPSPGGKAPSS